MPLLQRLLFCKMVCISDLMVKFLYLYCYLQAGKEPHDHPMEDKLSESNFPALC